MNNPDEEEVHAKAERAMQARRWSLNQVLAWIATRSSIAVGHDRSSLWVRIWATSNPGDYTCLAPGEDWAALQEAGAGGLHGVATMVICSSDGSLPREVLGAPFPPDGQPGAILSYRLSEGSQPVLWPQDRYNYVQWAEYRDLTFKREDVVAWFPPRAASSEPLPGEEGFARTPDLPSAGDRGAEPEGLGKGAGGRPQPKRAYAETLLLLAFPDGVPPKGGALQPGELVHAALVEHGKLNKALPKSLQKPDPKRETILRAAGWK